MVEYRGIEEGTRMTVLWSPQARNGLKNFSKSVHYRIIDKVIEFQETGRGDIKKIAEGLWRLRVGDYRVYSHKEEERVYVLRIVHRSRAYREDVIEALKDEIEVL